MDTMENQLREIQDELILKLITQMAKPTVTLTQLKDASKKDMEEIELRGALGRLWRSVKIYRHSLTTGVVLYWPEERLKVVASSGIQPDMPEGYNTPKEIEHIINPVAKEFERQELKDEVKQEKLTKHEENQRKSKWQLVPISQTAALPMRPMPEGEMGTARRTGVVSEVLSAFFKYRDVRLSIDGAASLLPHLRRTDVARVISQTVNGISNKKYMVRFNGDTRFDHTYQWNHQYAYPFPSREETDGKTVAVRNVDPEVEDDEKLDHIPVEQLTDEEKNAEIARLLGQAAVETPQEEKIEEPAVGVWTNAPDAEEAEEESEDKNEEHDVDEEDSDSGFCAILPSGFGFNYRKPEDNIERTLTSERLLGMRGEKGHPNLSHTPVVETETKQVTVNVESDGVFMSERRRQKITISDESFRAGVFTDGIMVVETDHGIIEFTPEQTNKIVDLLGPQYLRKAV